MNLTALGEEIGQRLLEEAGIGVGGTERAHRELDAPVRVGGTYLIHGPAHERLQRHRRALQRLAPETCEGE